MQKSQTNATESTKTIKTEKYAATREWIESQQQFNDESDDISSFDGEESVISSIVESTDYETDNDGNTYALGTQIAPSELTSITEGVKELFNSLNSVQTLGNVKIENSTGVHIGNVTNINGNIQIFHSGANSSERRRSVKSKDKRREKSRNYHRTSSNEEPEEREERVSSEAFIDRSKFKVPRTLCPIIPRHSWLAQRPMEEYDFLKEPVSYVVISHTATESSEKRAINVRTVRDVQCFHIESRGWNDIAYNFLIGCDGNIYEGRGWGVVGAHTLGYNTSSIGITFIGCFMVELPSKSAMTAFKNLLKKGVEDGHLTSDYRLITHAQCCSTESPGRKLIEELQTYEHFYRIEDEEE